MLSAPLSAQPKAEALTPLDALFKEVENDLLAMRRCTAGRQLTDKDFKAVRTSSGTASSVRAQCRAMVANEKIPDGAATHDILFKLGSDAYANSKKADALVVSCGALRTLDLIVPLENHIKVPVVSSTPHGLMNGVRLLGLSPRAKGYGMVLARA